MKNQTNKENKPSINKANNKGFKDSVKIKSYTIQEIEQSLKAGIIIKPVIGTALKEYLNQRKHFKVLEYY